MMNFASNIILLATLVHLHVNFANCDVTRDSNASGTNSSDIDDRPFRINLSSTVPNLITTDSKNATHSKRRQSSTSTKRKASQSTIVIQKNPSKSLSTTTRKPKPVKSDIYECPNTSQFQFFPTLCTKHSNCIDSGKDYRCCRQFGSKRCVQGVFKPLKEQKHEPLLGIIPRKCPADPLAELFWEVKACNTDHDCWPRICCPDGRKKYCRTSKPELENLTVGRQLAYPIESLSGYLQCTPPPPSAFDAFPKTCNNTLDCFPNVCCQESGKKHCRPPKRSLLAFVTGFAQFNRGVIKQWTDNLVIRR